MSLDAINFGPDFKLGEDYIVLSSKSTETETIHKLQVTATDLLKINKKL